MLSHLLFPTFVVSINISTAKIYILKYFKDRATFSLMLAGLDCQTDSPMVFFMGCTIIMKNVETMPCESEPKENSDNQLNDISFDFICGDDQTTPSRMKNILTFHKSSAIHQESEFLKIAHQNSSPSVIENKRHVV